VSLQIVAGTPPGGGQDRAARALAAAIGAEVVNIAGRGGSDGWDHLAEQAGRDDIVAVSSPTMLTNTIHRIADHSSLTPLGRLCSEGLAFAVAAGSDVDTPAALAGAISGGMTAAVATARGNINHAALLRVSGGRSGPVRDFGSARLAVADVVEGNSGVAVVSAASVLPEVEAGTVRVVAVSAHERLPAPLDDTPTWVESGVDCSLVTWRGVVGPPGMDGRAVREWDERLTAAVASGSWKAALTAHLWIPDHHRAADERRMLDDETALLSELLAGVTGG